MVLGKRAVKLIAVDGDLTSRERVPNNAKLLVENGIDGYDGMWKDISIAIDEARKYRNDVINSICCKLGKSSWEAVRRMDLEELQKASRKIRSLDAKKVLQDAIDEKRVRLQREPVREPIETFTADDVWRIYNGSDGSRTRKLYSTLKKFGVYGELAALCLAAQKTSDRAKEYRGDYKGMSYDKKGEKLRAICDLLESLGDTLNWGWGTDHTAYCEHVLYIDLPTGQVSWHSPGKYSDKIYNDEWDGTPYSRQRVVEFARNVLRGCGVPYDSANIGRSIYEVREVMS